MTQPRSEPASPRVAILAYDQLATFEFGCAVELFALPRPEWPHWYQTEVISFDSGPLRATGGILISARQVSALDDFDMLVIPGWSAANKVIPAGLLDAMRALHQRGGRILTFCSGAFLLAESGLLDGRRATTHWRYADGFRQRFPATDYVDNVLYVLHDQLGCSAGSAAGLDLGLAVIREDFGYDVANSVARRLVISPHRQGGQAQFVDTPILPRQDRFSATLDWARKHLHQPLGVDQLADQARMSRRSFDRHFRAATGMTPQQWLISQRLTLARGYLETTADDLETLADKCGFGNALTLRHHFRKQLGISPSQYRQQFAHSASHQARPLAPRG